MAYVPIPKDLSNVKTKIMFNLTKRQLICFSIATLIGFPVFFITKDSLGTSSAVLLMMLAMSPFFMLAMYEKHNQPLEVMLMNYLNVKFLNPKKRPYITENFYIQLEQQNKLDMEVANIVKHTRKKTNQSRTTTNSTYHSKNTK